jgi:hypothetical protein
MTGSPVLRIYGLSADFVAAMLLRTAPRSIAASPLSVPDGT